MAIIRTVIPTLALDRDAGGQSTSSSATGSIIGGVIGGAAGLALIVAGLVLYKRRRSHIKEKTQMYNEEFYGDPYRQDEWNNTEFNISGGGFPGTGEQVQRMNPSSMLDDDDEDFYRSQQRRSWWSSMSSIFRR